MQTVARYYNNAFADQDKQMAINLFLGVYVPEENSTSLWELSTDYYLHHLFTNSLVCPRPLSYTKWWSDDVIKSLPRPVIEVGNLALISVHSWLLIMNPLNKKHSFIMNQPSGPNFIAYIGLVLSQVRLI